MSTPSGAASKFFFGSYELDFYDSWFSVFIRKGKMRFSEIRATRKKRKRLYIRSPNKPGKDDRNGKERNR